MSWVVKLKSLSFEPNEPLGSVPIETGFFAGQIDTMKLVQLAVFAAVALILGIFVLCPLLLPGRRTQVPALPAATSMSELDSDIPVLNGTIEPDTDDRIPILTDQAVSADPQNAEDAVARLKTLIEERRSETVEVLRSWLDDPRPEDAR